jgi:RNA polymerase sigma factor (sigma-70 family)
LRPDELLTSQYELIEGVIAFTARRHHLNDTDAQEFRSQVLLKLVENDYHILRKFRHESSFRTFITVVIQHQCLDFRTAQWGKWRPSAEALRQGPLAVLLEKLLTRDGHTFSEACEILRTNHRVEASDAELQRLHALLPHRLPRRHEDDSALVNVPADGLNAESAAIQSEASQVRARLAQALERALFALEPRDRLLLKLRFRHDMTVAYIARALRCEQAPLYPYLKRLFATLRKQLEEDGFGDGDIDTFVAGADLPPDDKGPSGAVEMNLPGDKDGEA